MIPGLLPDEPERRFSWMPVILGLLAVVGLGAAALAAIKLVNLQKELDGRTRELDQLREILRKPVPSAPAPVADVFQKVRELEERLAKMEAEREQVVETPPPPPTPREPDREREIVEHIASGIAEFRAGRHDPAELHFLQALPGSTSYLILTALSRGDLKGAFRFLNLAIQSEPERLFKVTPRDLLGSAEEVLKLVMTLEDRTKADPMDVEAKMLLAYVYYHEKGGSFAKALLVDVTQKQPENEPARRFLEAVESHP